MARSRLSIIAVTAFLFTGCSSMFAGGHCELEPAEVEALKARVLGFLDDEIQPSGAACEDIADSATYVRGHGCGIYGLPAGSDRPGCPDVLDGDYFVIFDPETLQPIEIVWIAW